MDSLGSKRPLACIRCADKRIKCNRQKPCTACVKHNSECEYRLRKPRTKRNTVAARESDEPLANWNDPPKSDTPEAVGNEQSNQPEDENTPSLVKSLPQVTVFQPKLLQGQDSTRLVDNSLWSRIAEEVHSEDDSAEDGPLNETNNHNTQTDFGYALNCRPPQTKLQHPEPYQIRQLWQIFVDNVDPLLKITHVPSLQPSIEKAISKLDSIPKAFEALMFSIYSMAILSISDEECRKLMGTPRGHTLDHFIDATKLALARANFMSSTSLVMMQALTLHVFSIRQTHEPRAVWNLSGLVNRVAQGMGVCIDGTLLGLSPFETEIRRRLWWQLKSHDSRAAELCGQAKFREFEMNETTPKPPANVNDADLYPSMTEPPVESKRATEMCWNVLRTELATFAVYHKFKATNMKKPEAKNGFTSEEFSALDDMKAKDDLSDELEELLETKYLRFCDPAKPLQLLMHLGARCATDYIRFIAHHPRRWVHQKEVPESERRLVWNLSLSLLDRTVMLQTMPQIHRFSWITPYYIQWPVVIHILDVLRTDPRHQDFSKAWKVIDAVYEVNIEMLLLKRPIFAAVGKLCLKAHDVRMAVYPQSMEIPTYISRLQQHHRRSRSKVERAVSKLSKDIPSMESLQISSTVQQSSGQPVSIPQENNDFWLNSDINWQTYDGTPDTFEMDIDVNGFITSDQWLEDTPGVAINWDQWDAWLANSRVAS